MPPLPQIQTRPNKLPRCFNQLLNKATILISHSIITALCIKCVLFFKSHKMCETTENAALEFSMIHILTGPTPL